MSDDSALARLIAARDPDAMSGFYDRCGASVASYCAAVCGQERSDDATLSAMADFLGRLDRSSLDADLDMIVRRAARGCAAARLDRTGLPSPCDSVPEVLAASANGELMHGDAALRDHLEQCERCRQTAEHLQAAETCFSAEPGGEASEELRNAWLELAGVSREDG